MHLSIERGVRRDWLGRPVYRLALRLLVSDVEAETIVNLHLADVEIWASAAALDFDHEARAIFERASVLPLGGWRVLVRNVATILHGMRVARRGDREARVTVGDLLGGAEFEADEVAELIMTAEGVKAGFAGFLARFERLVHYVDGSREVIEVTGGDDGIGPREWVRLVR